VKLVLASNNPGKLLEMRALISLTQLPIELVAQSALGIAEAEEPHQTFLENALAKARHASRDSGLPALADDSGLCVTGLGGAPGVYSALYAGEPRSDARNNEKLLAETAMLADRRAHYACVMVLVRRPDDPQPVVSEGVWRGEVALAPRGAGGFGYDPLFWLSKHGCTAAELDPQEKNRISHRGIALASLLARFPEWLREKA
jgi:XTP/dITP diphosphohydrolase